MTEDDVTRAGAVARRFLQGDVLELSVAATALLADLDHPLSEAAIDEALAGGEGVQIVAAAASQVVLLTQTCDLQRTKGGQLFAVVAAIEERSTTVARDAWRGGRPQLAGLPWLSDTAVADLGRVTTIERSLLVTARQVARPGIHERPQFAEILGRYFNRPAIPDQVYEALSPIQEAAKKRHDNKDSAIGRRLNDLFQTRILLIPDADDPCPDVTLLFLLEPEFLPQLPRGVEVDQSAIDALARQDLNALSNKMDVVDDALEKHHHWSAWAEIWAARVREKADSLDEVGDITVEIWSTTKINYARATAAMLLDLSYLSTRAPAR